MDFVGRTPEFLIPRSDSRNPATTCKGITKSGRSCRRAIDAKTASGDKGVLAVVSVISDDGDDDDTDSAAYFCWQHKRQAEQLAAADESSASPQTTQLYPLQERTSIDTLVARLGLLDIQEPDLRETSKRIRTKLQSTTPRLQIQQNVRRPPTWDRVEGPLMSIPSDLMAKERRHRHEPAPYTAKSKRTLWDSICCGSADGDYVEVVRHRRRQVPARPVATAPSPTRLETATTPRPSSELAGQRSRMIDCKTAHAGSRFSTKMPARKALAERPDQPLKRSGSRPSQTSMLLSYIPKTLAPLTASNLLAELSKPISQHDEDGYIYIFWLTPEALEAPSSTASSLLASQTRPEQDRQASEMLRQYSLKRTQARRPSVARRQSGEGIGNSSSKDTILLKIGRANNVTRRLNEWSRQCGYALSLVRWYPYVSAEKSSSPAPKPPRPSPAHPRRPFYGQQRRASEGVRKVPHAHRVERLIHLELAAQRVTRQCVACGKDHREWFEVEASREAIKAVDQVVRRWVDWAEITAV